jgi:hypothetical protein
MTDVPLAAFAAGSNGDDLAGAPADEGLEKGTTPGLGREESLFGSGLNKGDLPAHQRTQHDRYVVSPQAEWRRN